MKTTDLPPRQIAGQHIDPLKIHADVSTKYRIHGPNPDKTASDMVQTPSQDRIRMSMHQRAKTCIQDLSQQIHQIDQAMETIDKKLGEMYASLETIIKQYPPYPPESAERIEGLRRFSALRKIIDQLTFPRQVEDLEKTLEGRKSYFGNDGLNIPDIGPDAGDDQILETLNKVKVAQDTHQRQRQDFLAGVNQALDRIG